MGIIKGDFFMLKNKQHTHILLDIGMCINWIDGKSIHISLYLRVNKKN